VQSETCVNVKSATSVLAEVAGGQYGLLRTHELLAAGLDPATITRWVHAKRLHRRYRGVYTLGHEALSREGEFLAAVFAGGDGSMLSFDAGAELYAVRRKRASLIDVVIPRKRLSPEGVRFHQARQIGPKDVTVYNGVPVATIPRLLLDLAESKDDGELANIIHEADFRGWFNEANVRERMRLARGRRLKPLEGALELRKQGSAGTKSRAERAMRRRLAAEGIDALPNVTLEGFEVDLHVPGTNLIVEVDGSGHGRPRTQEEDALRDKVFGAAGYEVVRVPATRPARR
jgi:very-short-patch-repair endonuclease